MNVAILDFHPPEPSARELMELALAPHMLIGMPHLTPTGLSETWAMKELGHRHWLMLARHLGMENADFRTPDGGEAYAAICATSLEHANFDAVRANDVLTIRSALSPISRTQVSTRHRLFVRGNLIGEVELISTFVCRMREGDNYSIARVPLPGLTAAAEDNALARTAALLRAGTLETHFGLPANPAKALRGYRFEPDASQEFNGAGLFYFAEFQALTDRAFGRWFPELSQVSRREIFFSGNIRPGEAVRVELMGLSPDRRQACCRLRREEDGKVIGKAFMEWQADELMPA
ncbi:Pnap_2097 family protein [Rhizobium sp. BK275]|uniref:Pnap_2097 family protein n=1 Tax=Rhizobium sp. BK275 TaxID=2587077 RepID=UPI00160CBDA6|nr:Pnap_2097 family protein [Rhizobium sp. BK275]